jgi:hypothetical protein
MQARCRARRLWAARKRPKTAGEGPDGLGTSKPPPRARQAPPGPTSTTGGGAGQRDTAYRKSDCAVSEKRQGRLDEARRRP